MLLVLVMFVGRFGHAREPDKAPNEQEFGQEIGPDVYEEVEQIEPATAHKRTYIPCVTCVDSQRFDPDDAMEAVANGQRLTDKLLRQAAKEGEVERAACLTNKAMLLGSVEALTDSAVRRMLQAVDDDRPSDMQDAQADIQTYMLQAHKITSESLSCGSDPMTALVGPVRKGVPADGDTPKDGQKDGGK